MGLRAAYTILHERTLGRKNRTIKQRTGDEPGGGMAGPRGAATGTGASWSVLPVPSDCTVTAAGALRGTAANPPVTTGSAGVTAVVVVAVDGAALPAARSNIRCHDTPSSTQCKEVGNAGLAAGTQQGGPPQSPGRSCPGAAEL